MGPLGQLVEVPVYLCRGHPRHFSQQGKAARMEFRIKEATACWCEYPFYGDRQELRVRHGDLPL